MRASTCVCTALGPNNSMPNYRRFYVPGGTYFLTIATYERRPLLAEKKNVDLLRKVLTKMKLRAPF